MSGYQLRRKKEIHQISKYKRGKDSEERKGRRERVRWDESNLFWVPLIQKGARATLRCATLTPECVCVSVHVCSI